MIRMYNLRQKEVINLTDGIRYGFVSDLLFCPETGQIKTLIVPGPGRVLGFLGRDQEYRIPWDKINKIGDDIVLVECTTSRVLVDSD